MTDSEPYVGLRSYGVDERDRFYGRGRESRDVSALWQGNKLVVLYGPSGVGKSSLIRAGVMSRFEREAADVLPVGRVSHSSVFPTAALPEHNLYTFALLSSWSPSDSPSRLVDLSLADFLGRREVLTDRHGDTLPVLAAIDQFEELFNSFPHRNRYLDEFMDHLAEAVATLPSLRLLISIRENALANLLPYEARLAGHSRARSRILPLARRKAVEAVARPLEATSRSYARGVAEKLVEDLCTTEITSHIGEVTKVVAESVEPVQLQVVCAALWRALPEEVTIITEEHLNHHGDIDRTLTEFCTRMITEVASVHEISAQELYEWLGRNFITDLGTRGTAYEGLSMTGGMPNSVARALENCHILKSDRRSGSRWYELQHDRLIEPIRQLNRQQVTPKKAVFGTNPAAYLRTAESALAEGELELARKHAEEALRICDDRDVRTRGEAESFLGNIEFQCNRLDVAENHYRRAAGHFETLRDRAAVGRLLAAIGRLLLARGRIVEAISELQAAVTRLQGDLTLQVELSRALWSSGQPRAAVAILGRVLTIAPDMAEALADRGQIRVELNDLTSALEDLNSLLRLRPDTGRRAEARAARALAHARLGRIGEATTDVDAALVEAPDSGPVLLYASKVARDAGQRTRADHLLLRAREAGNPALLPHQLAEVRRALTESPEGKSDS